MICAPLEIALAAVYAASHVPASGWTHACGLGGLFGDTVLGAVLSVVPVTATFGIKLLALLFAVAGLTMGLFVLGFTMPELRSLGRWMAVSLILVYATLMALLGKGAAASARGAGRLQQAYSDRAERKRARAMDVAEEEQALSAEREVAPAMSRVPQLVARRPGEDEAEVFEAPAPAPKAFGLRLPSLKKRAPEPELAETYADEAPETGEQDARIKAKIADVIKQRVRGTPIMSLNRPEPPVARQRGPKPMLLNDPGAQDFPEAAATLDMPDYAEPLSEPQATPVTFESRRPMQAAPVTKPVVQHQVRKPVQPSRQAQAEAQPQLQFEEPAPAYEHPPLSLLTNPADVTRHHLSDEALEQNARMLETVLDDYGVKGEIVSVRPGPVVTMYELEPAPGLKASRVIGLADDIARSMSALSARVSTVPGRSVIGIELPNANRERVVLREILSTRDFGDTNMRLPLALGKDIGGDAVVANLAKMPHLLIAGTTGSGKSVAINTMILSLLSRLSSAECRLIMIDPNMLELVVYDGLPHLLSPVVTDPTKAGVSLTWSGGWMEESECQMANSGCRNI